MKFQKKMIAACVANTFMFAAVAEEAQQTTRLDEVVVTATRTPQSITAVPGSVSVITRQEIETQTALTATRDLGEMLPKLVPGLAVGSQSMDSYSQTLRGRTALIMIDGVPQSVNPTNFRDFMRIDPSAIERIEVIRGATAIYGEGATGGIINIITRKAVGRGTRYTTGIGANVSTTHASDSLGGNIAQSISGKNDSFDYAVNASLSKTGGLFDAKGDRTMPGSDDIGSFADSNTLNLLGKAGWDIGTQRLALSANHYRFGQESNHTPDPASGTDKASYLPGLQLADQPYLRNTSLNLDYTHPEVAGSRLHGQLFLTKQDSLKPPFDGRPSTGLRAEELSSDKLGGRLEVDTPLSVQARTKVLWGLDYTREKHARSNNYFDGAAYDSSGGVAFNPTTSRTVMGPLDQKNLGLFAQLEWNPAKRWIVRGGARHERIDAHVDSFINRRGNAITGGNLSYDATVFNAGVVFLATDAMDLFASYSQGFSAPNLNATLSNAAAGTSVAALNPKAQEVDNIELGARGEWERVRSSLSAFYSTSELGTKIDPPTGLMTRTPQRIYGVEATVDAKLLPQLEAGGTISWSEGKDDGNNDGSFDTMSGYAISPLKLTAYLAHQTAPGWNNRVQLLYSGDRSKAYDAGVDAYPVESFSVVDLLSRIDVGSGTVRVGVENLLNEEYKTPYFQVWDGGNNGRAAARGRVVSIGYSVSY